MEDADQGIISTAIENAKSPSERPSPTPTNSQFTFTCESDSSKGMALRGHIPYAPPVRQQQQQQQQQRRGRSAAPTAAQSRPAFTTHGTQTSPNGKTNAPTGTQIAPGADITGTSRKKKRFPGGIYALAARQLKIQQQYANLHHPPALEDIWICEFCEYENIFGRPPEALIRQYEIKDRREQKRLAEKRRLLEKAKMKGRKGKKATKKIAAQHDRHHHHHHHHHHDHDYHDHDFQHDHELDGHCCHEHDYDDYDDESVAESSPAPELQHCRSKCLRSLEIRGRRSTLMVDHPDKSPSGRGK